MALRTLASVVAVLVVTRVSPAAEFKLNGYTFTLPEGFVIERAAGPDLAPRPIVADFDERGRLYVADSSGSSENVQKQLKEKPHRIVRLEDADGDGRFDRSGGVPTPKMLHGGARWGACGCRVSPTGGAPDLSRLRPLSRRQRRLRPRPCGGAARPAR